MGMVWAGRDLRTGQVVALKALRAGAMPLDEARARLRREAHATRAVAHPAIVPVVDILDFEGSPVLVMELLTGETFRAVLQREHRLPLARAAAILAPVARALASAHAARVVHRDLKPENIFIEAPDAARAEANCVRLLDFGVARFYEDQLGGDTSQLTGIGALLGTAAYMAPEQALNPADVDHRVDIWALGVTLYEAIGGCRPIEGFNNADTMRQLLVGGITPIRVLAPELEGPVADAINAMLSRSPEQRPDDVAEMACLLEFYAPRA